MSKFKRIKHNGGIEVLTKRVKKSGTVDVGIIDAGQHEDSDLTVASIGFIHEFGTEHIPERSFLRSTVKEKKKEIIDFQKALLKKVLKGEISQEQALGLLGEKVFAMVKTKIIKLKDPPLKPQTIKRKGSTNPLIDTEQLKNSITYEVNR